MVALADLIGGLALKLSCDEPFGQQLELLGLLVVTISGVSANWPR